MGNHLQYPNLELVNQGVFYALAIFSWEQEVGILALPNKAYWNYTIVGVLELTKVDVVDGASDSLYTPRLVAVAEREP